MNQGTGLAWELAPMILRLARENGRRIVVAVAGESGSGKTVTALALSGVLTDSALPAVVVHQDDFFVRPPRANHEHRRHHPDSVGPDEVNLSAMQEAIDAFRSGAPGVDVPQVDRATDSFRTQRLDLTQARVLVVEGTYTFLLERIDLRVFHEASWTETAARRASRARDAHEPFVDDVLRIEHAIISPHKAKADVVIGADFVIRPLELL